MDTTANLIPTSKLPSHLSPHSTRQNIYIIFIEFDSEQTSTIISFLRNHQFAPRGKNIETMQELHEALTERSWDIIICKSQQSSFDPFLMTRELVSHEKDIPVIQLYEELTIDDPALALKNNIQAVLAINDNQLLLLHITREYAQLELRRKARYLEQQLEESHNRCKLLMDHSSLAIAFIQEQKIIYLNNTFSQLFDYQVSTLLLNKSVLTLVAPQERNGLSQILSDCDNASQTKQTFQLLAQRSDKSNFTAHIELQQIEFNQTHCIEMLIDADQHQLQKNKFKEIDAITGLYNLNYFTNTLENSIRLSQRGGNDCHLIYIDVLNLAEIRSLLGAEASRTLARDIADVLTDEYPKAHVKARLSDNIFSILYSDPDTEKTQQLANATFERLSQHITLYEDSSLTAKCIISIVPLSDASPGVQQVLERAQRTIKVAANVPQVIVFNSDNNQLPNSDQQSMEQVKEALENEQLQLLFQPLVPLAFCSDYHHYEVLLRMIDKENNSILPAQFMFSMENADLDEAMDRWVIATSVYRFRKQLDNNQQLKLFISVTDTVWQREELLLWLAQLLRSSRIKADHIVIQISEAQSANKLSEAEYFVKGLRQLKCLICLKHYGSTNRSKDILKTLDPDYIKFDGSFIQELADDAILDPVFTALLKNAKNSGKITIAPQVEDPHIMSLLWKHEVGMLQGYYLQPPEKDMSYQF